MRKHLAQHLDIVENQCQLFGYSRHARDSAFIGTDKVVAVGLGTPIPGSIFLPSPRNHKEAEITTDFEAYWCQHQAGLHISNACICFFQRIKSNQKQEAEC